MPFTPVHMGSGILVKAILKGRFSLLFFGRTQIVMDIQPLLVMISGKGHLHKFCLYSGLAASFIFLHGRGR